MTNANKAKGSSWERTVVEWLRSHGLHANRIPAGAALDRGDISLDNGHWAIECKNTQAFTPGPFLDEAMQEAANAVARYHVVLVKRRGKAAAQDGYALMSIGQWGLIVNELKELEKWREFRRMNAL